MIATDNEYLQEASNTLFDLNADFNVRERCRNREEIGRASWRERVSSEV